MNNTSLQYTSVYFSILEYLGWWVKKKAQVSLICVAGAENAIGKQGVIAHGKRMFC